MADLAIATGVSVQATDTAEHDITYPVVPSIDTAAATAVCYNSAGKVVLAQASSSTLQQAKGILLEAAGPRQGSTLFVRGRLSGFDLSGLKIDDLVYLSDTAGALATVPSTTKNIPVGRVVPVSDSPNMTKVLFVDFTSAWTKGFGQNAVQSVTVGGGATGGTFTLVYGGQTATITYATTLTAASVQASLIALSSIGANNVSVTGANGGPFFVTFQGTLRNQTIALMTTGGTGSLTGGTPTLAIATTVPGF